MGKFILLLLSSFVGFAQQSIELKLVNDNIGTPFYNSMAGIYGANSNDAGLNAILLNHNVMTYADKGINAADNLHYMAIDCGSCNLQNLKQDLINYNSVIQSAGISDFYYFNNTLIVRFINNNFITSINPNNGIIETNDSPLNSIFQNHNVYLMNNAYSMQDRYFIKCNDCNLNNLKTELESYVTGIINTEYVTSQLVLNNETFENKATSIYPNPFQNELKIESVKTISNYEVIDISGKMIINSQSKTEFENSISQLNNGIFFLQLNYDDSSKSTHKIIKN